MPKMKTHKGTKKRFRLTAKGKVKRRSTGTSHLASRMSHKRKRNLRGTDTMAEVECARRSASSLENIAVNKFCGAAVPAAQAGETPAPRVLPAERASTNASRSREGPGFCIDLKVFSMRTTKGAARNRAKNRLFKKAKGYVGGRRRLLRTAKENLVHTRLRLPRPPQPQTRFPPAVDRPDQRRRPAWGCATASSSPGC